ncbi:MAG TPA: YceI family protein [Polaromonas sp.]|uniref:YceI family protein n=1 Tax=Polaromonas sp. TaxID=1869339 RepID=UPI002D243B0A|nr:YceI family protein [Polaromonas sp.]HYW57366.1 YceI family protein [Polaromonas sp.]
MKAITAALALLISSASIEAAEYRRVDLGASRITFTSRQMGVAVDGAFRKFDASVALDPAAPAAARGQLRIDLASIDTGVREVNEEVTGTQWFDVKSHPEARFDMRQIQPQGGGRFQVNGTLTIKGIAQPVVMEAMLKPGANQAVMDGSFVIKRLDYGIGGGVWGDVKVVANEVTVQFQLVLRP